MRSQGQPPSPRGRNRERSPTRHRLMIRTLAGVLATGCLLLAGCASGTGSAPGGSPSGTPGPGMASPALARSTWSPGADASYLGAPLSGDLRVDRLGCTYVVDESDTVSGLLWPRGFTARWSGTQVAIEDGTGTVVATSGSRVSLSGGYPSAVPGSTAACDEPSWSWYEVQVVLRGPAVPPTPDVPGAALRPARDPAEWVAWPPNEGSRPSTTSASTVGPRLGRNPARPDPSRLPSGYGEERCEGRGGRRRTRRAALRRAAG